MAEHFPSLASSGPSSLATESFLSLGEQEPEFVSASDAERFKCPVHHGILRDPRQTTCGHRLCTECVTKWLDGAASRRCPVGEADCENITVNGVWPDNSIARDMKIVQVYCSNKVNGCSEQRKLRDLKNHINKECQYETVPCPFSSRGCKEKTFRGKLDQHRDKCPFRPEHCTMCHQEVSHNQLTTHEEEQCPEKVTGCPFGCGDKKLKRREVQDHRDVCPVRPIDCKFKAIGCKFVAKRENVEKHLKEDLSQHLELVTQKAAQLELKNLDIQNQLQTISVQSEELQRNVQSTRGPDPGAHATLQQFESQIRDFRLKLVSLMERLITLERKMPELADKRAIEDITRNLSNVQQRVAQLEQRREQGQEQRQQAAPAAGGGTPDEVQRNIANIVQRIAQLEQRREQAHEQRQISTLPGGTGAIVRYGSVENMAEAVHVQLTAHDSTLAVSVQHEDGRTELVWQATYHNKSSSWPHATVPLLSANAFFIIFQGQRCHTLDSTDIAIDDVKVFRPSSCDYQPPGSKPSSQQLTSALNPGCDPLPTTTTSSTKTSTARHLPTTTTSAQVTERETFTTNSTAIDPPTVMPDDSSLTGSTEEDNPIPAIVGAVAGVVVLAVVGVVIVIVIWRMRKTNRSGLKTNKLSLSSGVGDGAMNNSEPSREAAAAPDIPSATETHYEGLGELSPQRHYTSLVGTESASHAAASYYNIESTTQAGRYGPHKTSTTETQYESVGEPSPPSVYTSLQNTALASDTLTYYSNDFAQDNRSYYNVAPGNSAYYNVAKDSHNVKT